VLRQAQADIDAELTTLHADLSALERQRRANSEPRRAALQNQIASLEAQRLDQDAVDAAFADFANVWNPLSPREQTQILSLLVARVEYDATDSTIALVFQLSAIKALADAQLGQAA
jgi:hypothetical protein